MGLASSPVCQGSFVTSVVSGVTSFLISSQYGRIGPSLMPQIFSSRTGTVTVSPSAAKPGRYFSSWSQSRPISSYMVCKVTVSAFWCCLAR